MVWLLNGDTPIGLSSVVYISIIFSNASGPNAIWIVLNILYYYWKFKMATKFNYAFGLVDLLNILHEPVSLTWSFVYSLASIKFVVSEKHDFYMHVNKLHCNGDHLGFPIIVFVLREYNWNSQADLVVKGLLNGDTPIGLSSVVYILLETRTLSMT
jgi:hypothetical protein